MLLLALNDSQELAGVPASGGRHLIPAVGYPRFPAWHPDAGLAYIAISSAPPPWQVVLAVTAVDLELIDIVPGAAVFAPPVWSPDGSKLLFIRGDSDQAEAVVWHRTDGRLESAFALDGLRSAAWDPEGEIVYSVGGEILRRDHDQGTVLGSVPAARGLLEFGSDDLYVTVDQLCISGTGELAATERWYRQGLAPKERIVELHGDTYREGPAGRYPQWRADGSLLFTSDTGTPVLRGTTLAPLLEGTDVLDGSGAHSAAWAEGFRRDR